MIQALSRRAICVAVFAHTSTMVEKRIWRARVEDVIVSDSGKQGLQASLL
jgi:hypothetical protein